MSSTINNIHCYVKSQTNSMLNYNDLDQIGVDALEVSLDLKMDRANASKYLNKLWREGKLLKIKSRPVRFLDYETIYTYNHGQFIPTTLMKNDSLYNYIKESNSDTSKSTLSDLDEVIGSNGSIREQITQAKAAVSYPPNGLNTLIIGNNGVGKSYLANKMVAYKRTHSKNKEIKSLSINCQTYANDHSSFIDLFLGSQSSDLMHVGILEKYNNGIIILENFLCLNFNSLDFIFSIIENKNYLKRSTAYNKKTNIMFIGTCTIDQSAKYDYLLRNIFPVQLELPDIDKRGSYEKLELLIDLFSQESQNISRPIEVNKDIMSCFLNNTFSGNITQLKNEIQKSCAKAFMKTHITGRNTLNINFNDLSLFILESLNNSNPQTISCHTILNGYPHDSFLFDKHNSPKIKKHFKEVPSVLANLKTSKFINSLDTDIINLENIEEYVTENIESLKICSNVEMKAIQKNIEPGIYTVVHQCISNDPIFEKIINHSNLYYGLLLHISNLYKRTIDNSMKVSELETSITKNLYPEEYNLASKIYASLSAYFPVIPLKEIDFLASYLHSLKLWTNNSSTGVLVIAHGEVIASSLLQEVKKRIKGEYYIDAIDYNSNIQLNDLIELACVKARKVDQGNGVIVVTDIEPLTSISSYISQETKINCKTIYPLSLPLLIDVVEKSKDKFNNPNTMIKNLNSNIKLNNISQDDLYIEQITNQIISKTVNFIDVNKAVSILIRCLNQTLEYIGIYYSEEITVKYLIHGVNMLERTISSTTWDYQDLSGFISDNYLLMHQVEKGLTLANNYYGITIPAPELAYITEIFQ